MYLLNDNHLSCWAVLCMNVFR